MVLHGPTVTNDSTMDLTWHFYANAEGMWRWERLSADKVVVESSAAVYDDYDACIADAQKHGYRYSLAKSTRPPRTPTIRYPRSYAKVRSRSQQEPPLTRGELIDAGVVEEQPAQSANKST